MRLMRQINKQLGWEILLIIISLLAVGWLQAPRLSDEFRVDEDFRAFYWLYKFQDASLFPNDHLQGDVYTTVPLSGPDLWLYLYHFGPGYSLLFNLASFFVTPIFFSKILPFFLMPLTVLYVFKFGQVVRNHHTGVILALGFLFINLASSSAISITNGLQRSFAYPLLIMFIYYLPQQKYLATALIVVISASIYAPIFILMIPIWGLFILRIVWQSYPGIVVTQVATLWRKIILTRSAPWRYRRVIFRRKHLSIRQKTATQDACGERWQLGLVSQGGLKYLLITLLLSIVMLSPVLLPNLTGIFVDEKPSQVNEVAPAPYQHLWENPTFQQGGSSPLFELFPLVGRGGLVDLGEDLINLLILLTLGCLIYMVRKSRTFALPYLVWCVLWSSLIMFVMAWLVIWLTDSFLLYLPSRYTRVGLFLFLFMLVFLNVDFIKEIPSFIQRNPKRLRGLIVGVEALVLILIVLYPSSKAAIGGFNMKWLLAPAGFLFGFIGITLSKKLPSSLPPTFNLSQTFAGRLLAGLVIVLFLGGWAIYTPLFTEVSYLNPTQTERQLFEFLETLPKEVLLAGTPCALDSVTLFAKRKVLFSCEGGGEDKIAISEVLTAYYTDDKQIVIDFCGAYQVDYLVVDLETYSEAYLSRGKLFFEPYNQQLLSQIVDQDTYVLAEIPDNIKLFQSENIFVVSCGDLT